MPEKFLEDKFLICLPSWQEGGRKVVILATLELLIWHSLKLFQHKKKPYKQNLIYGYRYVYGFSSITCLTRSRKNFF